MSPRTDGTGAAPLRAAGIFRRLCLAIVLACITAPAASASSEEQSLAALRNLDQRIATLGHRLAVANLASCSRVQALPGLSVHHLAQYNGSFRQAAAQLFGLRDRPQLLAVATGGPAERAGLQRDDVLLEVDGFVLPQNGTDQAAPEALIDAAWDKLEAALADGRAQLLVRRGGERKSVEVVGEPGCASRFNLSPSSKLNARADGTHVVVTTGIMAFVQGDDELAAVLAHELAHNIQRQRQGQQQPGEGRRRRSRDLELEADRLSVHLLLAAGFDPAAAVRFWQRLRPKPSLFSASHPHWRHRVAALEQEIALARAGG